MEGEIVSSVLETWRIQYRRGADIGMCPLEKKMGHFGCRRPSLEINPEEQSNKGVNN